MSNIVFGVSLVALGTAVILFFSEGSAILPRSWAVRLVTWVGRLSYELYLFHIVVLAIMKTTISRVDLSNSMKPAWLLLYFFISLLISELVSRYYAEPNRLGARRFFA